MNVQVKVNYETFDVDRYLDDVREAIRQAFIAAGRRFLVAAVPQLRIWTGFTRGAFRNLEDAVGGSVRGEYGKFRIRTGGGATRNDIGQPAGNRRYYYYPPAGGRVLRTPQAGRGFSTQSDKIISVARSKTTFYMRFNVDITYFLNASWGRAALKAGDAAFMEVMNNLRLPDYANYFVRRT